MLLRQFASYTVVGVIAFGVDAGLTLWLALKMHYIVANTLGFLVANLVNFLLSHGLVFRRAYSMEALVRVYPSVLGISVLGLLLSDALIVVFVDIAGLTLAIAKVMTTGCVLFWNFLARVLIVYKASVEASKHPLPYSQLLSQGERKVDGRREFS